MAGKESNVRARLQQGLQSDPESDWRALGGLSMVGTIGFVSQEHSQGPPHPEWAAVHLHRAQGVSGSESWGQVMFPCEQCPVRSDLCGVYSLHFPLGLEPPYPHRRLVRR